MDYTEQVSRYLKTLSVLYVEDDSIARGLLAGSLAHRCGTLIEACNGAEGLELFKAHHPDIVVTDIQMPVMDGLRMAEEICALDRDVPIIVTTAFEETDYFQRSIAAGVDRYVLKPIMLDQLQAALLACAHRLWLEKQHQLHDQQMRQAEKNEAIGQLAGGVAHHFNNILQVISGNCEFVMMHISDDDPNRARISTVIEATHRAAQINQGLLAFSQKQMVQLQQTDINDVVRTIKSKIVPVPDDTIRVQITTAGTPLECLVDRAQIDQVLKNLVSNACNAMKNGGVVSIETSLQKVDDSFVQLHGFAESGDYALVSVSDTGIGMDKEALRHIFNPFYTTREIGQGIGLGLPMSLGIVKTHNGFINVYSEPDNGTTVRVYLPIAKNQEKDAVPETPKETPPGGTETILVVDDSAEIQQLLALLLTKYGYTVVGAGNGQDAVEAFRAEREQIALVVTDVFMEGMAGAELAQQIRLLQPDMKFLFTSGYPAETLRGNKAFDDGADLICKPFRPYDLLKKVRELLDKG
ncbi:MAG: response regulator [Desulfuromonadaceae bacterium]|nr:response regulator [Desulfuromonadaceae bacterium]MDD5105551.1 response regulator [Desulfuromonadaceae bacterium]